MSGNWTNLTDRTERIVSEGKDETMKVSEGKSVDVTNEFEAFFRDQRLVMRLRCEVNEQVKEQLEAEFGVFVARFLQAYRERCVRDPADARSFRMPLNLSVILEIGSGCGIMVSSKSSFGVRRVRVTDGKEVQLTLDLDGKKKAVGE